MKQTDRKAEKRGALFDFVYLAGILGPDGVGGAACSRTRRGKSRGWLSGELEVTLVS